MSTDRRWDLAAHEGRARALAVYDIGSIPSPATAAPWSTVTGTGTASIDTTTGDGPRYVLGIGAGAGTATLDLPGDIFLVHAAAVCVDVEGVRLTGTTSSRPNAVVELYQGANAVQFVADSASSRVRALRSGETTREVQALVGNAFPVPESHLGFCADYDAQSIRAHMGGSMVGLDGSVPTGTGAWRVRITNTGSTAQTFAFAKATVTVVWKRSGTETVRVVTA